MYCMFQKISGDFEINKMTKNYLPRENKHHGRGQNIWKCYLVTLSNSIAYIEE